MDGWIDWKDGGDGYSGGQWFVKVAKFDHVVQNHIGNQKKMLESRKHHQHPGGTIQSIIETIAALYRTTIRLILIKHEMGKCSIFLVS